MSLRVGHKVLIAFGVPTLVFVGLGIGCLLVFSTLTQDTRQVAHTRQVLLAVRRLELSVAHAQPHRPAPDLAAGRARLESLVAANPDPARRLAALGPALEALGAGRAEPAELEQIASGLGGMEDAEEALLAVREARAAAQVAKMQKALVFGILGALLFTVLSAFGLVRSLTRRIGLLVAAAERVGRGEFSPVPVEGGDELSVLARAFDEMAGRRREAEAALRETTATALAANRELESFSYAVSHDLRAPLRSIDGFSQALLEDCGPALPELGKAHLARVRAAAQRMGVLIDDLIQLSRVARAPLERAPLDLSELARGILQELESRSPERRLELSIEAGLHAEGDARLVKIALANLLENAWKFSARKEYAKIEVGRTDEAFFVRDNGAGYDPTYQDKLFGAFQRLHPASEFEGTGIGLATVQRVVARHGGRVWSVGRPGEGATFFFTLGQLREA